MNKDELTTKEVARLAGVNRETLRYYERVGLLPEPPRTPAGYRRYTHEEVKRLLFIKNAKSLGFKLSEIKALLGIADGDISGCREVRKLAQANVKRIDEQIASLTKLRAVLSDLISQCTGRGKIADCPIIESLTRKEEKS